MCPADHERAGSRRLRTRLGSAAALALFAASASVAAAPLNARELLEQLPFSAAEQERILGDELVRTTTAENSDRELAVGMAFIVRDPKEAVVEDFRTAGGYRFDPDVKAFGEFQGEGSLTNLAKLGLAPGAEAMAKAYTEAEPGDDLNLSQGEIDAFRALNSKSVSAVEEQLRKMLLARYRAYRAGGLSGIPPYLRSGGRAFQPSGDLRKALDAAKALRRYSPAFHGALLGYPKNLPAEFRERFFWVQFTLDDKPTFVLTHRSGMPLGEDTLLAERHYYVSRSHNSVQVFGGLIPVTQGTLVYYLNRTSTDQAAGFGASTKHKLGRRIMGEQIAQIFERLRADAAKN